MTDSKRGIVEVTRGGPDLRTPPDTPLGRTWLYQITHVFQVTDGLAGLFCNIREGEVKGVDFEQGGDVILFDDLSRVSAEGAVPVTRNHEEGNPNSDPPGKPGNMVKYPTHGGFVPLGAKRSNGSPHPHEGTGFSISQVIAWRTDDPGEPPYGLGYFTGEESYAYLECFQYAYDGASFRVVKTERLSHEDLLPGWKVNGQGMAVAIPDGEDLLMAFTAGNPDAGFGAGVMRWRRRGEDWRPVSFVPIAPSSREASLTRDLDGSMLFCTRGGPEPDYNDIRVWRSTDRGETWAKVIHVRGVVSSAPITLNRAADGTPYIAANLYEVFVHPADGVKMKVDAEGQLRGGGWTRKTLCIWPLNEERSGLLTPIIARDCRGEWGPPPGGSTWRIDHPSGTTVKLGDGQWHHILGARVVEYAELTHAMGPTPQTGAYLEEVISAGEPIPAWNF